MTRRGLTLLYAIVGYAALAGAADATTAALVHESWWSRVLSDPVALFTAVLALFSLVLVVVGTWQGVQLRRTVSAMEAEFVATHRPRVILRDAHAPKETNNEPVEVHYTLVNTGETPATIVASALDLQLITALGFEVEEGPHLEEGRNDVGHVRLAPGESATLTYKARLKWNSNNHDMYHTFDKPNFGMIFYGHLVYEDDSSRRVRRHTAFRRKYEHSDYRFYLPGDRSPLEYVD
jgi:hypothetical protein